MIGNNWLDLPGTVMIYLENLLIPIIFFKRRYIPLAWFIYLLLHLGTLTVDILFLGVILSWLVFLPVYRVAQKIIVVWDGNCSFCEKSVNIASKLDWFGKIDFISSNDREKVLEIKGWDGNIDKGLWAQGIGSNENYIGFDGFRRMAWVMPLFWFILPILYLPLIPTLGRKIYGWIANNRYKFGCNSNQCTLKGSK